MMECMQETVKGMVLDQLKAAGFDPDLSAGTLTTLNSVNTTLQQSSSSAAAFSGGLTPLRRLPVHLVLTRL